MQYRPESRGLELGPREGTSFLGIYPIPLQPGRAPDLDLLTEATEVILAPGMEWHSRRDLARSVQLHFSFPERVTRTPGILGMSIERGLQVHFSPGDRHPLDALYIIEQSEGGLPPALAGAVLSAALAKRLPSWAPTFLARACDHISPQPSRTPTRMNRAELEKMVRDYLDNLAYDLDETGVPASGVDRARFWMIAAQQLWSPDVQARIALNRFIDPFARDMAGAIAAAWLDLQGTSRIRVAGTHQRVSRQSVAGAWSQVQEWSLNGISVDALRFLVGTRMPEGRDTVEKQTLHCDAELCCGLASALLQEADEQAEFVPNGAFVLSLPDDYPLRSWGVSALRVWAEPTGLWLAVVTDEGHTGASFRWQPDRPDQPMSRWQVSEQGEPLVHATLAALWRDLRVAGGDAVPAAEPATTTPRSRKGRRRRRRRPSTRTLPTPSRPGLTGARTWGSTQERETIRLRAHGVRGHLRQLRAGHRASDEAKRLAAEFGIVVPAGRTFVRPHVRGGERETGDGRAPAAPIIKARGLASVMMFAANGSGSDGARAECIDP